ncbi:MAG: phosphoribosylanthranilate isomerase [Candidatus Omnitrophota bacterium]
MVKVKICGLTNLEDAVKACECGADLLGFVFVEGTPRAVQKGAVKSIVSGLPGDTKEVTERVGLFKDEKPELAADVLSYCGLNYAQLVGEESPEYCRRLKDILNGSIRIIKTFKVKERILPQGPYDLDDYGDVDYFVFDSFHPEIAGGTGRRFDWEVMVRQKEKIKKPFFIAGGLTPENVHDAVTAVGPYGVDVSSGVEKRPGEKDWNLLKEFIKNAKK